MTDLVMFQDRIDLLLCNAFSGLILVFVVLASSVKCVWRLYASQLIHSRRLCPAARHGGQRQHGLHVRLHIGLRYRRR